MITKEEAQRALMNLFNHVEARDVEEADKLFKSKDLLKQFINENTEETEIEIQYDEVEEKHYFCKSCNEEILQLGNVNYCPYCDRKIKGE